MTLGDQNLTAYEVQNDELSQSLVTNGFFLAASKGIKDREGRLHQNLIVVDADAGVTLAPIRSDVIGFNRIHQAVQARICREPSGPEAAPPPAVRRQVQRRARSLPPNAGRPAVVPGMPPQPWKRPPPAPPWQQRPRTLPPPHWGPPAPPKPKAKIRPRTLPPQTPLKNHHLTYR